MPAAQIKNAPQKEGPAMRLLCLGSITLVLSCAVLSAAQKFNAKTITESVVQIGVLSPQDNSVTAVGSGFFVGPDKLITDGQVYWGGNFAANQKRSSNGVLLQLLLPGTNKYQLIPLTVIKSDDAHDLVVLRFDPKALPAKFQVIPLAISETDQSPEVGSEVTLFGHFETYSPVIALRGSVAGYLETLPSLGNVDELLLSLSGNPGFSGGPIVSMDTGAVIGVMEGFLPNPSNPSPTAFANGISRATRSKYVRALIASLDAH
jgi:S1-C subfamily serine protease